ncbi:MAG: zinc ribbon domain-containing protein [Deltaproteobacteria bacterium]|nr:zinc ribbon domain-containing protein [Deltaproteobacteria bacterium]MBW1920676.1 zinc ribbon domain-containing protein [Deltaproteobacteria bacterium]MBW1935188.1 zinc ribbon domain-containing protein [Deltaproteobacteria bacterium]MBW1977587.1 zinc ribbon domain-containing protein [Deltaproteobacteria bacterium]MBW2044005.1 zinc ribbon domain-containing protein [Deltaproteobacteria bacterium]
MPIYEYECTKCGHHSEVWQKITDPPLTRCEQCKGRLRKLISQSTFHLKGTGWYVTDYASKRPEDNKKPSKQKEGETSKPAQKSQKKETPSGDRT